MTQATGLIVQYDSRFARIVRVETNGAIHVLSNWFKATEREARRVAQGHGATLQVQESSK